MNNLTSGKFYSKNKKSSNFLLTILILGITLRLFHYFYNRSLWMDEVYLSSSLLRLNYSDLTFTLLDYQQKAPVGFLWLVKLTVNLFGNQETVLRMIPLIAGIVSLFLYLRVCKYFLKPWAQLLAMTIFAFAPAIIYHSVEIKQYATECLATVIALYLFTKYHKSNEWKDRIVWGIYGALTLWFSYSVIFMLVGIAAGMSWYAIHKKDWRLFFNNLVTFGLWMISFLVNYFMFTHKHAESQWVVYWFRLYNNFMPFPPHNIRELKWFSTNFYQLLDYPLGVALNIKEFSSSTLLKIIALPVVPVILLFTGAFSIARKNSKYFYILLLPVVLMLIASGLHLYPLLERFWLFIAPVFILFIALGFEYYQDRFNFRKLLWIVFILLIIPSVFQSVYFIIHPEKFYKHKKSYERESLVYINDNFQQGDAVYVYWNNLPGFKVYQKIIKLNYRAIEGGDYRRTSKNLAVYNQHLQKDFTRFSKKKRVWLLFNTQFLTTIGDYADDPLWYYKNRFTPAENLFQQINKVGKPLKTIVYKDVTLCLVELGLKLPDSDL